MDKDKLTKYVLAHSKTRDEELKYDFMPSLLEIIERPAHKASVIIIVGIFTLLAATVIWASASKVDVVVNSNGSIQPVGNVNVVEAVSNGVVKKINVSEGQHVEKGELLIELDSQNLEIDVQSLKSKLKILEAERKVLKQIEEGKTYSDIDASKYDKDIRPSVQAILDKDASFRINLNSLENERSNAELNQRIAQLQLEEYNENGSYRQVQSQQLVIQQATITQDKINIQINNATVEYSAEINMAISDHDKNIETIKTEIEKNGLSLNNQKIISPVSGVINSLEVNTSGETVTGSEKLITIVPDDTPVEMVCYVQNMDIADIYENMEAEIKLEAYPYTKFGTVPAKVTYISPSSFSSDKLGSVYLVKLEICNTNDKINIFAGLSGKVEFKTGTRTIMNYFLDPILKGFGDSMKEK